MATYSAPIPEDFFYFAYLAVFVATALWALERWASVGTFRVKHIVSWEIFVLIIGVGLMGQLRRIQVGRELLSLNGVLFPSSISPLYPPPCPLDKTPRDKALVAMLGGFVAISPTDHLTVISADRIMPDGSHRLLSVDRDQSGQVTINLYVFDREGKVVLEINRNHFQINRNRFLDSLAPPRPDKSTILIQDEEGNDLKIRLLNPNIVSFSGRLYFAGNHYADFADDGISTGPPPTPRGMAGFCVNMGQSNGAVIHFIRKE